MDLESKIEATLLNDALDDEYAPEDKLEVMEKLIAEYGWDRVQPYMIAILRDNTRRLKDWYIAAAVFFMVLSHEPIDDANAVIALVYHRLYFIGHDNLAWSIACTLKKVDYLSDYDPMEDSEVIAAQRELGIGWCPYGHPSPRMQH